MELLLHQAVAEEAVVPTNLSERAGRFRDPRDDRGKPLGRLHQLGVATGQTLVEKPDVVGPNVEDSSNDACERGMSRRVDHFGPPGGAPSISSISARLGISRKAIAPPK